MDNFKDFVMDVKEITKLLDEAIKARVNSHSPYSKFKVGAALQTKAGKIYRGCNIENASFGLTICAERTAIFKAISEGESHFKAIAVVADVEGVITPCGACRQIIYEFCPDVNVIVGNIKGKYKVLSVTDIYPHPFNDEAFT